MRPSNRELAGPESDRNVEKSGKADLAVKDRNRCEAVPHDPMHGSRWLLGSLSVGPPDHRIEFGEILSRVAWVLQQRHAQLLR